MLVKIKKIQAVDRSPYMYSLIHIVAPYWCVFDVMNYGMLYAGKLLRDPSINEQHRCVMGSLLLLAVLNHDVLQMFKHDGEYELLKVLAGFQEAGVAVQCKMAKTVSIFFVSFSI